MHGSPGCGKSSSRLVIELGVDLGLGARGTWAVTAGVLVVRGGTGASTSALRGASVARLLPLVSLGVAVLVWVGLVLGRPASEPIANTSRDGDVVAVSLAGLLVLGRLTIGQAGLSSMLLHLLLLLPGLVALRVRVRVAGLGSGGSKRSVHHL